MNKHTKKGQGLVEYALLVGLIALVAWTLINEFGSQIGSTFSNFSSNVQQLNASNKAHGQ